jgi:prepilin-type N-terminal cleavage/methylation domain-containing protein
MIILQAAVKLKTKKRSGFSLLEVIVTLFIVGLVLILYQAALGKVRLIQYAKNQEIALRVANNKIEELRDGGYSALPSSGSFYDSQLSSLSSSSASMAITDANSDTKQVSVTVQWKDSVSSSLKNISLTTLITKTGGL